MEEIVTEWHGAKEREDLKPCPFCGARPYQMQKFINQKRILVLQILCCNARCRVIVEAFESSEISEVEQFWNTRI